MGDAWKKEFKQLCIKRNNDGEKYLESLAVKFRQARDYHQKNILQLLNDAKKLPRDKNFFNDSLRLEFELYCECDAFMNTLYSMFDIMAQMANECVVRKKKKTSKVYFKRIEECGISPEIKKWADCITSHSSFRELDDYCRTSKHRKAVDGLLHFDFRESEPRVGYVIVHLGEGKPLAPAPDTANNLRVYLDFVGGRVSEIGKIIVSELKKANG